MSGGRYPVCRLKQLGLSAAGRKKGLTARLDAHTPCPTDEAPQQPVADEAPIGAKEPKVGAGTGVFQAQKRKNFVRINLKVCPCIKQKSATGAPETQQATPALLSIL